MKITVEIKIPGGPVDGALGNAVVRQQLFPIFKAIAETEKGVRYSLNG
jgi:hypothetical protein